MGKIFGRQINSENDNSKEAFKAISSEDIQKLKKMLKHGLNPNTRNGEGETLLISAIKQDNEELVKLLLKSDSDVEFFGKIKDEIYVNNGECQSYLGEKVEVQMITPLMQALNLRDKYNNPKEPNMKIVQLLLDYKADVNAKEKAGGLTPLHFAANQCSPEAIQKLIEAGANVNAPAFISGVPNIPMEQRLDITPIALAIDHTKRIKSAECVDKLFSNGGDINHYNNAFVLFGQLLSVLADKKLYISAEILFNEVDKDLEKMNRNNVSKTIDLFLKQSHVKDCDVGFFAHELIGKDSDFSSQYDKVKYFAHLNSWVGYIAGDYGSDTKPFRSEKHLTSEAEGMFPEYQSFSKIKSLLYILKGVCDDKIDCQKKFDEPKENVINKLRDEIYNQVTTYFTIKHQDFQIGMLEPTGAIKDGTDMLKMPAWYFSDRPDIKRQLSNKLVRSWSKEIGDLKPGESFCMYLGSYDHATYMQFKKEDSQNITRIIYNLGGGSEPHQRFVDGKTFPNVIKNIPVNKFKFQTQEALASLYAIINARKNSCYEQKWNGGNSIELVISDTYKAVYDGAKALGGMELTKEEYLKYIPMRDQIAGNCTVKNNLSAIKNRMGSKLSRFVKNVEILTLKDELGISADLIGFKEMEKDIKRLNFINQAGSEPVEYNKEYKDKYLFEVKKKEEFMETNLFSFFRKRAKIRIDSNARPADRIAFAMNNFENPQKLRQYFEHYPDLFDMLNKVALYYNSADLRNAIRPFSKAYEVSTDNARNCNSSEEIFNRLERVPSSGLSVLSEFSKEPATVNIADSLANKLLSRNSTKNDMSIEPNK